MNKRKILTFITALTMSLTSLSFTPAYVVAEDSTAAVAASEENKGIYFSDKEDASIMVETGINCGITLGANYNFVNRKMKKNLRIFKKTFFLNLGIAKLTIRK